MRPSRHSCCLEYPGIRLVCCDVLPALTASASISAIRVKGLGPDVHPFKFTHKGKKYEYLYIKDEKGLLEVVQMGSIEIHPWGASIDAIDCPDRLIFDLDPAPDVPFEAVKLAAQDLRQRLKRKGLESMLKCTGGKGPARSRTSGEQGPMAEGEILRCSGRERNGG